MEQSGLINTGTRTVSIVMIYAELVSIIADARWLLIAITLFVFADFRYGWGENSKRYEEAKKNNDRLLMMQYKWRTSRAIRRTINKLIDYLIWVTLGMIFGISILKPLNVDYIFGGLAATMIAVACEGKSILGHFMFLHGIVIQQKTIKGFVKAFVIALAKRKNKDIGEAIEEGFNKINKK